MSSNDEGYIGKTFGHQRFDGKEKIVGCFDLELMNGDCNLRDASKGIGKTKVIALNILPFVEGNKTTLVTNDDFSRENRAYIILSRAW